MGLPQRSAGARSSRPPRRARSSRRSTAKKPRKDRTGKVAKRDLAELKIPASPEFIPVAKRVATTLGSQLGLSLVDLDELTIALTQACDSAIAAAGEMSVHSELKLTYFATNRALVVDVDLLPSERHALPVRAEALTEAQLVSN